MSVVVGPGAAPAKNIAAAISEVEEQRSKGVSPTTSVEHPHKPGVTTPVYVYTVPSDYKAAYLNARPLVDDAELIEAYLGCPSDDFPCYSEWVRLAYD